MAPQRYERISDGDHEESTAISSEIPSYTETVPSSPPPSFRSRASSIASRHLLASEDPIATAAERTLHDTFDDGSDSDEEDRNGGDDRQRLIRSATIQSSTSNRAAGDGGRPEILRTYTHFPGAGGPNAPEIANRPITTQPLHPAFARSNDGVFANMSAKPERGEKLEEQPPSYEAAAADAAPPYWENTIMAPGNLSATDEVFVDGLPVGSVFSFVWNGMISMSFQFVGFLLTYLLHTTHAAKNGSRAGLGVTLVQYGFWMRAAAHKASSSSPSAGGGVDDPAFGPPADPNAHDSGPDAADGGAAAATAAAMASGTPGGGGSTDWLAYALMIIGWFILIRAVTDFVRARKHEQLVLQSPDRGLNVPVVADNERPESVV